MPESVFTQTIPALLAGGACLRAAGFEAGADAIAAVPPPESEVAAGAGLLAGAVETAGVAAGERVSRRQRRCEQLRRIRRGRGASAQEQRRGPGAPEPEKRWWIFLEIQCGGQASIPPL